MKKPGYWVQRWLVDDKIEGPFTAYEAGELVEAFTWDGEYRRALELANVLTDFYVKRRDWRDDMMFGQFLGMRTVLMVLVAKADNRRTRAAARRAAA